jgi:hypothetical protein
MWYRIWRAYKGIFVFGINFCYPRRRSCCFLGEWLIIIIFIVWVFWPVSVPLLHAYRVYRPPPPLHHIHRGYQSTNFMC